MDLEGLLSELCGEISGLRAKEAAADIARHHRVQASPGFEAAVADVRAMLAAAGIESHVHTFPADGTTTTYRWTAPPAWSATAAVLRQVKPRARTVADFAEVPQALVVHSPPGEVDAELVHVGRGTAEADYRGREVAGRAVLACGRAREVLQMAGPRGAAAMIIYPPSERAAAGYDLIQYQSLFPTAEEIPSLVPAFSISRRTADQLMAELEKGPVRLRGRVEAAFTTGSLQVVEAELAGDDRQAGQVLLCAHLCHPRQSANDNASGSGLLVELARALAARRSRLALPHTLRFLWVPEFNGTLPWARARGETLQDVWYAVNLDMVGQSPTEVGTPLTISRAPDSVPSYVNAWLAPLAARIAAREDAFSPQGSRRPLHWVVEPPSGGSDHLVFSSPPARIPAVMFGHHDPFWHTDLDTMDRVDPSRLKQVGVVAAALAALPALLRAEPWRLQGWLLAYSLTRLIRARELAGGDSTRRAELAATALDLERQRAEAFGRLYLQLTKGAWPAADHLRALEAVAGAPPGAVAPAAGDRPTRTCDGPVGYRPLEELPPAERQFVEERLRARHLALLEEAANLCDGTRTVAEIARRLILDFEGQVTGEDVRHTLDVLSAVGFLAPA
ncbi:MAG: DUF4910 domain-containing protein [Candidatus Bipolaricaulaceae bacterium]